jgi:NADH-quinone oxidoreductase subunit A
MFLFLGILILGLAYVWVKGDLDWIKPKPIVPTTGTHVPLSLYEELNREQSAYTIKEFTPETQLPATTTATATTQNPPIRKPMFKPTFKKPGNEQ